MSNTDIYRGLHRRWAFREVHAQYRRGGGGACASKQQAAVAAAAATGRAPCASSASPCPSSLFYRPPGPVSARISDNAGFAAAAGFRCGRSVLGSRF